LTHRDPDQLLVRDDLVPRYLSNQLIAQAKTIAIKVREGIAEWGAR